MSDLSPEMQEQCHRVSQKACDTIFGLLMERWKMTKEPQTTADRNTDVASFNRGRTHGLKEALNAIRAMQHKYAKNKKAWDAVNTCASVVNLLRSEKLS